jgi:hypothetical protein
MTPVETSPHSETRQPRMRGLIARASGIEKVIYASIGRVIARKPAVPAEAKGFGYHSSSKAILVVFIVLSAIEIVVIDLIVHRWLWLRIPLLVIGIWGLIWMIGLLCAHLVRPHTVGPDGIHVRDGLDLDAHVRWDDVHSVTIKKRGYDPRTPRVIADGDSRTLAVDITGQTNIEIVLERPTVISLPGVPPKGGEQAVTSICLWADDPKAFLAEVGNHI